MNYDFDTFVPRRGTDCEKWDSLADGVLPLWVADMDFRAAPAIVDALKRRANEGVFGYAHPPTVWHESLARWLARRHGWEIDSGSVLDATGVIPALAATIRAFCKPGDKVIIQPPVYNCFYTVIRDQGCTIVENRLRRVPVSDGTDGDFTYEIDFEDLERKAADAKLLILSNPHNPAGRAWRADELRRGGEICLRHGVFVASDEIHADLQMPGSRHVPFASLGGDFARNSATFWSATKAFNLAGLQTAAVVCANAAAREKIRHALRVNRTGELNVFGFVASKTAWDECAPWLDELRDYLHGNYTALLAFVRDRLPALQVAKLEATYLAWVDATPLGVSSAELARRLEHEAKVKFSPGAIYGEEDGSSFLRVNLACPRATLHEALERTAGFIDEFKRK
jgi:cystathionine beta-lyase